MLTSIVLTAHNRAHLLANTLFSICKQKFTDYEVLVIEDGYDGGYTKRVVLEYGALIPCRYFQRTGRPDVPYSNQAVPLNIGIRYARGDVLILANAECEHQTEELICKLTDAVLDAPMVAHFCHCEAEVMENGQIVGTRTYCGPHILPITGPLFFCGSILREHLVKLRGFDEDFQWYGWEDVDMNDRLRAMGIELRLHDDWRVIHRYHPPPYLDPTWKEREAKMKTLYEQKRGQMLHGEISPYRNLDHEWGQLEG